MCRAANRSPCDSAMRSQPWRSNTLRQKFARCGTTNDTVKRAHTGLVIRQSYLDRTQIADDRLGRVPIVCHRDAPFLEALGQTIPFPLDRSEGVTSVNEQPQLL